MKLFKNLTYMSYDIFVNSFNFKLNEYNRITHKHQINSKLSLINIKILDNETKQFYEEIHA